MDTQTARCPLRPYWALATGVFVETHLQGRFFFSRPGAPSWEIEGFDPRVAEDRRYLTLFDQEFKRDFTRSAFPARVLSTLRVGPAAGRDEEARIGTGERA